jgi:hypothetical protein
MASISNSGNRELSSSQINKSTHGGHKEGFVTGHQGLNVIKFVETFADMKVEMKEFVHKKAEEAFI